MLLQLGNFLFDRAFSPDSLSFTDETSYAEHALINLKPRLQPTGNNLEEISLTIRLRAEMVAVNTTILALKKSKDEFEVLPFIYGTGIYKGDYIITKLDHSPVFMLADGYSVEATVSLSLKEYVVADKLQQQQNAARKQAFAVGKANPVRIASAQLRTPSQASIQSLSGAYSQGAVIDQQARVYNSNPTMQTVLNKRIASGLQKMNDSLDAAKLHIADLVPGIALSNLTGKIDLLQAAIGNVVLPVITAGQLAENNRDLQAAIRAVKKASITIINAVITRAA